MQSNMEKLWNKEDRDNEWQKGLELNNTLQYTKQEKDWGLIVDIKL